MSWLVQSALGPESREGKAPVHLPWSTQSNEVPWTLFRRILLEGPAAGEQIRVNFWGACGWHMGTYFKTFPLQVCPTPGWGDSRVSIFPLWVGLLFSVTSVLRENRDPLWTLPLTPEQEVCRVTCSQAWPPTQGCCSRDRVGMLPV